MIELSRSSFSTASGVSGTTYDSFSATTGTEGSGTTRPAVLALFADGISIDVAALFSKKNDARLQLLENELLSVAQREMTISQFFYKVKSLCREISELDPTSRISESRMRRIIIHGLRPEYRSFITAIQGWPTQPSIADLENLLANQESLAKQMAMDSLKSDRYEDALFSNKRRGRPKRQSRVGSDDSDDEKMVKRR